MRSELTLMAVHAHPDDEASTTGGVLARYSAQGVRTVVVTCTNGELGDGRGGIKPDQAGFSEAEVVATRAVELEESCALLGVAHLERLGYHDSGMMGWPQNAAPGSFWSMDVADAARPLAALMEQYRPQVVVTYDANGFYGHPDHIQAHRITMHAAEATGIPSKIYFPAFARSSLKAFGEALVGAGMELPEEPTADFGTPDEEITTSVDCAAVVQLKRAALEAHRSQTETTFFVKMPPAVFGQLFATESFVRAHDRSGASVPEDDLFAGLR